MTACEKVRYRNRPAALAAIARILWRDKRGRDGTHAYQCPRCGGWHLTKWSGHA